MAHFARLKNNIVQDVVVIDNANCLDDEGKEVESIGIDFCKSLWGDGFQYIKTSYNGKIRGKYAGVGDLYDSLKDEFISLENN